MGLAAAAAAVRVQVVGRRQESREAVAVGGGEREMAGTVAEAVTCMAVPDPAISLQIVAMQSHTRVPMMAQGMCE